MSQARCNARRRRQAANGYAHMSGNLRRPIYKRRALSSIGEAIEAERRRAIAEANRARKKKV
jgi:hypothetical protein